MFISCLRLNNLLHVLNETRVHLAMFSLIIWIFLCKWSETFNENFSGQPDANVAVQRCDPWPRSPSEPRQGPRCCWRSRSAPPPVVPGNSCGLFASVSQRRRDVPRQPGWFDAALLFRGPPQIWCVCFVYMWRNSNETLFVNFLTRPNDCPGRMCAPQRLERVSSVCTTVKVVKKRVFTSLKTPWRESKKKKEKQKMVSWNRLWQKAWKYKNPRCW